MTPSAMNTLPLATTPAFTPAGRQPAAQVQAWARAMEDAAREARREGWQRPSVSLAKQSPGAAPDALAAGMPISADRATGMQAGPASSMRVDAALADRSDSQLASATPTPAPSCADCPEEDEPTPEVLPRSTRRRDVEPAPVRIHVERHAQGLALWLGVDASVSRAALASLLARLSRHGGVPITALTCNGHAVFSEPPTPKETPWP